VNHALALLGWLEMPEQDQPPESIWLDEAALAQHFQDIRERYQSEGAGDAVEDRPMVENDLVRGLRRG